MTIEAAKISEALNAMFVLTELHDDALDEGDLETAEEILYTLKDSAGTIMDKTTPDYLDTEEQELITNIVNANFNHYSGENNEVQ
jgi:hypothetical protein|tara:strand:+ start:840 stop:1094 length:255 start_codon:yes stop_codon:yes gene_type:complete